MLEKRTFKKLHDFELMTEVLRCLRSLMNLEQGMLAMIGITVETSSSMGTASSVRSDEGGEPSTDLASVPSLTSNRSVELSQEMAGDEVRARVRVKGGDEGAGAGAGEGEGEGAGG